MNNNNHLNEWLSVTFLIIGGIFKLISLEKKKQVKFIQSATNLNEVSKPKHQTIIPSILFTNLNPVLPITLKHDDKTSWICVNENVYFVHNCRQYKKQDHQMFNQQISTYEANEYKELQYITTNSHNTQIKLLNINNKCIDLNNLLPIISHKFEKSVETFQPRPQKQEEQGILNKLLSEIPRNISNTENSLTIDMKPTFVGKLYKRSGLINDNSLYLIIGNYNGKEFIIDDNLTVERNKTVQNVTDSMENTLKITNYISNGALLTSAFFVARFMLKSRL